MLVQLLLLRYPVAVNLPSAADREVGRDFVEHLRGVVLIATAPYLAARAGKGWQAHNMALQDLERGRPDVAEKLRAELTQRVTRRYYARIYRKLRLYRDALPGAYARTDYVLPKKRFYPVTGAHARPEPELAPRRE